VDRKQKNQPQPDRARIAFRDIVYQVVDSKSINGRPAEPETPMCPCPDTRQYR